MVQTREVKPRDFKIMKAQIEEHGSPEDVQAALACSEALQDKLTVTSAGKDSEKS